MAETGGVVYTALGLCGECGEYYGAFLDLHNKGGLHKGPLIKEAGDICWYLVEFLAELDIPVDVLINSEAYQSGKAYKMPIFYSCACAEIVKKGIRDNGRINSESLPKIIANLQMLWASLNFDMNLLGIELIHVLEENNRKLLSRLERNQLVGSGDNR